MWCDMVCHPVYHLAQTDLLANVHCNESLIWFKAFGFCYTINTGCSPKLLDISLAMVPWDLPLIVLQQFMGGVDVSMGQLKTSYLGSGGI